VPLTQDEITAIGSDVIRRFPHHALALVGVVASEGGSERVELMVTINGCHDERCHLVLNLSRQDRAALEDELRQTLEAALRTHTSPQ